LGGSALFAATEAVAAAFAIFLGGFDLAIGKAMDGLGGLGSFEAGAADEH
jgi:hypothetical protein